MMTVVLRMSEARRRIEQAGLDFEAERAAEAERRRRETQERQRLADGEPVAVQSWAERQRALWAERQPEVVFRHRTQYRRIVEEVCAKYEMTADTLMSPARSKVLVLPRQELFYRLWDETPLSLPEIGRRCGDRDHTTVLHGVRAHARRHTLPLPRRDDESEGHQP